MKKLCSLLCLIPAALLLVLPVCAEETAPAEDSVTISENILSCLDESEVDTVFRVYDMNDGYAGFVKYGDIDGVIANTTAPQLRIFYFVKTKQGETSTYTYDGTELLKTGYHPDWGAWWFGAHSEKTETVIRKVASDIVVENVYYLWDDSLCIYYKTNLGDYVYVFMDPKEYLMALDPFLSLQRELGDLLRKYSFMSEMVGCSHESWTRGLQVDLSPYDITSPHFDPRAPLKINSKPGKFIAIGSFVLLVVLIVCRLFIRNRRKNRITKEEMVNRI